MMNSIEKIKQKSQQLSVEVRQKTVGYGISDHIFDASGSIRQCKQSKNINL
ncbi:MAG: hypothetical protein AAB795_02125 [Patescibacteria group bacterium]